MGTAKKDKKILKTLTGGNYEEEISICLKFTDFY